jgi:hypothetical protein
MGIKRKVSAPDGPYSPQNSQIVELNVGGEIFVTLRDTLTRHPGTYLADLVSGNIPAIKDSNGRYFIDRDPTHFRTVLNFLRGSAGTLDADKFFYGVGNLSIQASLSVPTRIVKSEYLPMPLKKVKCEAKESPSDDSNFHQLADSLIRCMEDSKSDVEKFGIVMALMMQFAREIGPAFVKLAGILPPARGFMFGQLIGSILHFADQLRKDRNLFLQLGGDDSKRPKFLHLLRLLHVNCTAGLVKSLKKGESGLSLINGVLQITDFPVVKSHGHLLISRLKKAISRGRVPESANHLLMKLEGQSSILEKDFGGSALQPPSNKMTLV